MYRTVHVLKNNIPIKMNLCSSYPLKVTGKERQEIDDNLK